MRQNKISVPLNTRTSLNMSLCSTSSLWYGRVTTSTDFTANTKHNFITISVYHIYLPNYLDQSPQCQLEKQKDWPEHSTYAAGDDSLEFWQCF